MRSFSRVFSLLSLSLVFVCACKGRTQAPSPLTRLETPQGGKIVYGSIDGVSTQPAALANLLNGVQARCGEKPQIGRVFHFRGTNSVGVFFSVTDHPKGNTRVAGLAIAAVTGPNQVEAALLSDDASRFGQSVNLMLKQLFGAWHPGFRNASPGATPGVNANRGSAVSLHQFTLPDSTASVGLPDGWTVDPESGGGTMRLFGAHGEVAILNNMYLAQDPYAPSYRNMQQMGIKPLRGMIIYPANVDLVKALPEILQQIRRSNGLAPVSFQIDHAELAPAPQGSRCVQATGQVNSDEKGMQSMFRVLCATAPQEYGNYSFHDYGAFFPVAEASKRDAVASAIFSSFHVDIALVTQRANAEAAPHIAQMQRNYYAQQQAMLANSARIVGSINQIGANATARMNAVEVANDAQHARWRAGQADNARNGQGFSNYLLDQTVVQDNNIFGNGTVGHGTVYNSTADALVKADPNRFEIVDVPNYWQGTDFRP